MKIEKIAILTSGGDAPGMNAAIRAVTRTAINKGLEVYGVYDGYYGLYHDKIELFNRKSVANIINVGGTMLGSSRFPQFKEQKVREKAVENLRKRGIHALVVIGGDGSYTGARLLSAEHQDIACIGIPGTIDNDIPGTDLTIGFHTALDTAVSSIDKLRDTSLSHGRISIVEVMGRHCGDLSLNAAISTGCDYLITPCTAWSYEDLLASLHEGRNVRKKKNAIVIVTENLLDVFDLAKNIERDTGIETRATVLGHIQRGGIPVAQDRVLASSLGVFAVEELLQGKSRVCCGIVNGKLLSTDIEEALNHPRPTDDEQLFYIHQCLI